MIRNEVKLIGRLTANPELKYTKETNKALCNIVEVIVEQVDYLGYTKKGVDKSETIPKLDPDHKKQEEYQMIHDALCADEDLPF